MSDDLISRKAAELALIEKGQHSRRYKWGEIWELNGLEIREVLDNLPSVQPKEKTEKWIIIDDTEQFTAKCSECGKIVDSRAIHYWSKDFSYCGRCGAKMEA